MKPLKLFDLQEWNNKMGPHPVHVRTNVWGKSYAICKDQRKKLLANSPLIGTYYKIVDHDTKLTTKQLKPV